MSNRKTFTKMVLDQKPPASGRIEIRDAESPLVFRLTSDGDRKLCVRTRIGKEQVRITYPKSAVIDNLPDARVWARRTVDDCKAGIDPRTAQTASERALQRASELAEQRRFGAVVATYLERRVRGEKGNRTADEIERDFNNYWLPLWRDVSVMEIGRGDINKALDDIYDGKVELNGKRYGGQVAADRALANLRACFNWWQIQDDKFTSPIVQGMARTNAAKLARDRVLSDDEIRVLWAVTAAPGTFNSIVRSLLLTAQRRDEVACMARAEIADSVWTIPAERYKTGKANAVPLTGKVTAIIEVQDIHKDCDFVFSTNGETPFSGFGKCKKALDEAMQAAMGDVVLPHWQLHDLRRTARTLMSRAGVTSDHAERVLGHVIAGVEGTYDRHGYLNEKRVALEALAAVVERIVNPPADNVVPLRQAAE
jgi:integrase